MATYTVKEMFYTLQGEGAQAGRAAVFCRFAGCNLWTGREEDRATAVCKFCDTDFVGTDGVGGGKFKNAETLAKAIADTYQGGVGTGVPYVVFTGGEPTLQLDAALIEAVHAQGFEIAIETNGTLPVPAGVDWICVSPKFGSELVQTSGQELKVVVPQLGQDLDALGRLNFAHYFVQAMDDADPVKKTKNMQVAIQTCLNKPLWRLSVQTHKVIGMP
ncbi:7-carboxy-7-deazaguanine synthase [Limnobacter alexandrii]|uniref:7-carboxy-7-deazaguanine synthase n=1 Tax=Limnobacter alexandrii TaxID=2570352 RepID=UPI002482DF6D|nr:7-carboxy-7-deazaguanine synthase [Limnobacter alexandrii]